MTSMNTTQLLNIIIENYLESHDFNGLPLVKLLSGTVADGDLKSMLEQLVSTDQIGVLSENEGNPHIIQIGFPDIATQINSLKAYNPSHVCIYPRPVVLQSRVDQSTLQMTPYKLRLALGEPQLSFQAFDLAILEFYRNDPRYTYYANDIDGRICAKDEYFESDEMAVHDQIFMKSFGFAYNEAMNRSVAVFLRYLADLSPEHQQIWRAKEVGSDYKLHPDYFRAVYLGQWMENVPIFDAYLCELFIINQMARVMGRPSLFRQDFGEFLEGKPPRFAFLIRPTAEEFNGFVLLLDKLLSDNINVKFFRNDVPLETEIKRVDDKIEVQRKGTIQVLNDWVRSKFQVNDWTAWDDAVAAMKKVRKMRQTPAHAVDQNEFDQKYIKQQRDLICLAYSAVRTIRLVFANHPAVKAADIEIPDAVREGRILTY